MFDTTRTSRRMLGAAAYLERDAPRLAPAKFPVLAFARGALYRTWPRIELPRANMLIRPVGVGFTFSGFLRGFRLCPLAGLGFGHVVLAFPLGRPVPAIETARSSAQLDPAISPPPDGIWRRRPTRGDRDQV